MSGTEKGLSTRIKNKFPQIVIANNLSHCLNLVMKSALEKYDQKSISLVVKLCAYFSRSPLRRAKFREIQKSFNEGMTADILNVLSYVETRWASLLRSIKRVLMLWESLEVYFNEAKEEYSPPLTSKN